MEKDDNFKFPEVLLESIICQLDGGRLEICEIEGKDVGVGSAKMKCNKCGQLYALKNGVLEIIEQQAVLADDSMTKEILRRDLEAKKYDKRLNKRYEKEIIPTLKNIGISSGIKVIEYGCGTGRFTVELAKKCQYILAIDFSIESLRILQEKLRVENITNVGLVLADATRFRTREGYFDLACSFQMIEHIPHKWQRNMWYQNVFRTLKKGGKFVVTVYHNDLRRRIKMLSQTGFHADNIFYHYFTKFEIRSEFVGFSKIIKIKYIDLFLPLEVRLKFFKKIFQPLSKFATFLPGLRLLSHLLYIDVTKDRDFKNFTGVFYLYPAWYFQKVWHWFSEPFNYINLDMVNFFTYNSSDKNNYKKKKGFTSLIDVTKSSEELWQGMRKKFIKKQIEKGINNGIIIKQDFNFEEFTRIYNDFRQSKKIAKDNPKVFLTNGILFSAYFKEKMIAAGVFIADGENMRAWVLASQRLSQKDGKQKEIIGQANRMVIWEAMQYAHDNGFKNFDLGGISPYSDDPQKKSLAEFKEAFGGQRTPAYFYYKINSSLLRLLVKIRNIL